MARTKRQEAKWTQSIAVDSESFVEKIKGEMGFRARGRKIRHAGESFEFRETLKPHGATNALAYGNMFLRDR